MKLLKKIFKKVIAVCLLAFIFSLIYNMIYMETQVIHNEIEESQTEIINTIDLVNSEPNIQELSYIEPIEEHYITMYSTTDLNIREQPNMDSIIIDCVDTNTELNVVDGTQEKDWSTVKIDNNYYYVYSKYLSAQKIIIKPKKVEVAQTINTSNQDGNFLGYYTLTYYCSCAQCCGKTDGITASGAHATAGRTIATPSTFTFGTKLNIDGHIYTVEDRGGAIQGNRIDVYVDSHSEALRLGVKKNVPVYLVK